MVEITTEGELEVSPEELGLPVEEQRDAAQGSAPDAGEGGPATEQATKDAEQAALIDALIQRLAEQDGRQQDLEVLVAQQTDQIQELQTTVAQHRRQADTGAARLKPNDPPQFSGEDKRTIDAWIKTVKVWLAAGGIFPEYEVAMARTFLVKGAADLLSAKEGELDKQQTADGREFISFAVFEAFLREHFGYQDEEQVARDELDDLKQTGSVEDFARKFQACVARIKALPPSEGDLIQRFRKGLKPEILQHVAVDPATKKRWTALQPFIAFASAYDASRIQVTNQIRREGKTVGDMSETFSAVVNKGMGKRGPEAGGVNPGAAKKPRFPKPTAISPSSVPDKYKEAFAKGVCFECGKPGHRKVDCFMFKQKQAQKSKDSKPGN
jgi:hypothetical protein